MRRKAGTRAKAKRTPTAKAWAKATMVVAPSQDQPTIKILWPEKPRPIEEPKGNAMADEEKIETPVDAPATEATAEATEPAAAPDILTWPGVFEIYDLSSRLALWTLRAARESSGLIRYSYARHGTSALIVLLGHASFVCQGLAQALAAGWDDDAVERLMGAIGELTGALHKLQIPAYADTPSTFAAQRAQLETLVANADAWETEAKRFRARQRGTQEEAAGENSGGQ
jgi:hypothetical protein